MFLRNPSPSLLLVRNRSDRIVLWVSLRGLYTRHRAPTSLSEPGRHSAHRAHDHRRKSRRLSPPLSRRAAIVTSNVFLFPVCLKVSKAACILTTQALMKTLRSKEAAASVNVKTWPTILETGKRSQLRNRRVLTRILCKPFLCVRNVFV